MLSCHALLFPDANVDVDAAFLPFFYRCASEANVGTGSFAAKSTPASTSLIQPFKVLAPRVGSERRALVRCAGITNDDGSRCAIPIAVRLPVSFRVSAPVALATTMSM
jgi:hypothetical protein